MTKALSNSDICFIKAVLSQILFPKFHVAWLNLPLRQSD